MDKKELYKKALKSWGLEAQMFMLFEEMSELQKEIIKTWRGKSDNSKIAEEIVDVQIMIEQMCITFDVDDKLIKSYRWNKLNRLESLLSDNNDFKENLNDSPKDSGFFEEAGRKLDEEIAEDEEKEKLEDLEESQNPS
ncbi:MAG: hypothetical protein ACFFCM_07495 [Promethearchaeota archaeon]